MKNLSRKEMRNIYAGLVYGGGEFGGGDDIAKGYKCCVGNECSTCRKYTAGSGIPVCTTGTLTECTPN